MPIQKLLDELEAKAQGSHHVRLVEIVREMQAYKPILLKEKEAKQSRISKSIVIAFNEITVLAAGLILGGERPTDEELRAL